LPSTSTWIAFSQTTSASSSGLAIGTAMSALDTAPSLSVTVNVTA
jgi:hypothetical protein